MSHMSKIYLLISSLFVCLSINAQDAFDPIFLLSQPHPIIENIDSIIIYTYGPSYLAEDPDTIVVIGSDSVELVLQSKEVRTFPSRGVTVDVEYNKEGEKRSTLTVVQDQDGMVLTQKTEFESEAVASLMNSERVHSYENGKITSIVEKGSEVLSLTYDKEGIPTSFNMNLGFVTMAMNREPHESGYIYNATAVPADEQEGLLGIMGDFPKTYVLYTVEDDKHIYTYIEEDKDTGEKTSEETYIRNSDGQIIESIESKSGLSHKKYIYNSSGDLSEIHDLTEDNIMINEYDDRGNIILKHEDFSSIKSKYDEKNNMVEEKVFWGDSATSLQSMVIRKISYKQ